MNQHHFVDRERELQFLTDRYRSPVLESLILYLYIGSDKDIEDAVYLWILFRETLDTNLLQSFMERLEVRGEQYGIEV